MRWTLGHALEAVERMMDTAFQICLPPVSHAISHEL